MKIVLTLALLLCGCDKYYLDVKRERVNRKSLASSFVGSPDPRQLNPPCGQRLYLEYNLPPKALDQTLFLSLEVLFKDYTSRRYLFPILEKRGIEVVSFLGEDYFEKGGLLSYRAEISNSEGEPIKSWQEALWVSLISPERDGG